MSNTSKALIKLLKKEGYSLVRTNKHHVYKKGIRTVIVPVGRVKSHTEKCIMKRVAAYKEVDSEV